MDQVPHSTGDPAKISLTGIYLGQAVIAIMAVLAISGEYGTGMIRVTFMAVIALLSLGVAS